MPMQDEVKLTAALIMLLPRLACAGAVFDETTRLARHPDAAPGANHCYVEGDRFRCDGGDGKTIVILNNDVMSIVDTMQHTYQSLAKTAIDRSAAKLAALTPEKIASLPPEDRATVRRVMSRMRPRDREYRLTDRSEIVEGRACRIWEGTEGGDKVLELCVAPGESASGTAEIVAGLKHAGHFFAGGLESQGTQFGPARWWRSIETFDGLPILTRSFVNGTVVSETTLTTVHIEALEPELFDVPAGYQLVVSKNRVHLPDP
jgi:hypothetical protein